MRVTSASSSCANAGVAAVAESKTVSAVAPICERTVLMLLPLVGATSGVRSYDYWANGSTQSEPFDSFLAGLAGADSFFAVGAGLGGASFFATGAVSFFAGGGAASRLGAARFTCAALRCWGAGAGAAAIGSGCAGCGKVVTTG